MQDPDRACQHAEFQTHADIAFMEDSGLFQLDLRIWCNQCEETFLFPESLPVGVDLSGAMGAHRSLVGDQLRVAIRPTLSTQDL